MLNLFGSLIASNVPPRREGQGLAEYGMILIVASIPVVVVLFALAPRIDAFFAAVRSGLPGG